MTRWNLSWLIGLVILSLAGWLRLSQLAELPPSPYWEEVALGYDAFSITQTGNDHHGNPWPIVAFESFGDWKPSGYFYAAALSIKLFGLSVWSTRLPAALAGILSVLFIGWLGKILAKKWQVQLRNWPIIIFGLAAISPWGILFSRAAWEVMLATSLFLLSLIGLLKTLEAWEKQRGSQFGWLILTIAAAVSAMYTYHALRVVAPLVLIWTVVMWCWQTGWQEVQLELKKTGLKTLGLIIFGLGLTLWLLWPLISNLTSPVIQQRFAETSLLSDLTPIIQSNEMIAKYGGAGWAKLLNHRYWFQSQLILSQYLKHLNFDFLFLRGDANVRHSIQYFGQLYYLDAVFSLLGAFFIWRKHSKLAIWLLGWWLIGTFPAAISMAAPHALRTLPVWPVWIVLIGYGIAHLVQNWRWLLWPIVLIYLGLLMWFWQTYTQIYPKLYSQDWQSGYCEMYQKLNTTMQLHPDLPVVVSRKQGRPAMYYWFCNQTDPRLVQAANAQAKKDQGEFLEFGQLTFSDSPISPAIVATYSGETGWQINSP